jgi:hypothetical protein
MRRLFRLAVLLPSVTLLFPAVAADDPKTLAEEAKVRATLLASQSIEGRIVDLKITGDPKTVTVEYTHQIKKRPDPIAARKVDFLKPLYDKAVESKQQGFIDKVGAELEKAKREASGVEEIPIKFVLRVDAETNLRTLVVPLDDNGKPKKFTAEEQKKLKGDPRLPGLTATVEDLGEGQVVRFTVDKIKYKPAPSTAKSVKDAEPPPAPVYPISLLVIQPPPKVNPNENPFLKKN